MAIFLYRISYYIVPLLVGLILYIHETWIKLDEDTSDIIKGVFSKIAHIGVIVLVLLSGVSLLINEAIPDVANKISLAKKVSELTIIPLNNEIAIIVGFLLITISRLLIYKSKKIYKLALTLVIVGGIITITNYNRVMYLIIVGVILLISKRQFYRNQFVMKWGSIIQDIIILLFFQGLYLYTVYTNLSGNVSNLYLNNYKIQAVYSYGIRILIFSILGFVASIILLSIIYHNSKINDFPRMKLNDCEKDIDLLLKNFRGNSVYI